MRDQNVGFPQNIKETGSCLMEALERMFKFPPGNSPSHISDTLYANLSTGLYIRIMLKAGTLVFCCSLCKLYTFVVM